MSELSDSLRIQTMKIADERLQSIWFEADSEEVCIIDQTSLPHELKIISLDSLEDACQAIASMQVRGAPLIGVTAAYGVYLAVRNDSGSLDRAIEALRNTRPTAINLQWALQRVSEALAGIEAEALAGKALEMAQLLEKEDIAVCEAIGDSGLPILQALWESKRDSQERLNILTHCNAGALATVDWGTALSVVYKAHAVGVPLHVWVDETRPRNQGAALTTWELTAHHIPNTLIVDNAGGHLMQTGKVDICIVGSDRTTLGGDVCNKIGTYLKALAAHHNGIPFFAALPVSTIDFSIVSARESIPIEERGAEEVSHIEGITVGGQIETVRVTPEDVAISNFGFDITPAELVSGIITERGIFEANEASLGKLLE